MSDRLTVEHGIILKVMSKEDLEFDLKLHLRDQSKYTAGIIQQLLDTMRENERLKAEVGARGDVIEDFKRYVEKHIPSKDSEHG